MNLMITLPNPKKLSTTKSHEFFHIRKANEEMKQERHIAINHYTREMNHEEDERTERTSVLRG